MIQDDSRENLLIQLLNLTPSPHRNGWDAKDEFSNFYELKSTTKKTVSTARDLGFNTLNAWKDKIWIVGKGITENSKFEYSEIYILFPEKMNLWYEKIGSKLNKDVKIIQETLLLTDLHFENIDNKKRVKEILEKGIKINNSAIPWKFITDNGTKIEKNYADSLRIILKNNNYA